LPVLIGQIVIDVICDEVNDRPIGQRGRLIQNEATIRDSGAQRSHAATVGRSMTIGKGSGSLAECIDLPEP